ncbi:hypothetical protein [Roseobacter weihaiensis]|uniref:hypothetical protein n=1 Tax=Roseobacter weihaiensis TaxID=2763262 RepID=UPI001D0B131E|nr:hypothetical protein [Roseobacter sp. H9]
MQAEIALTYDPRVPVYSITITRSAPWPQADIFAMQFSGPAALSISTDRHSYSLDGLSVTVTDSGFGNVLDGLQFNDTATAILGGTTQSFDLAGAADAVEAFRLCQPEAGV